MKFVFVSSPTFEPWDWTNPDTVGIGGSETSHIEMSNRLSDHGHDVISYGPTPYEEARLNPHGVAWARSHNNPQVWNHPDTIYVLYRDPTLVDQVPDGCPAWLICQDVHYSTMTEERAKKFTRIVALCEAHAWHLRGMYPFAKDKVVVSSNGVKTSLIREALKNPPARNPRRLMYASSPDRGLLYLAMVFERAKEIIPDLELHCYYGFDNIDKIVDMMPQALENAIAVKKQLQQPGIFWHGRTAQPELIQEWLKAGIWCHPSSFTETSCITCMDAQACGAIPITTPIWAIAENVKHGVFIEGDPYQDPLVRARYVAHLVKMADADRQDAIRPAMMAWAQDFFDWENFVGQWEKWADKDTMKRRFSLVSQPEFAEAR